MIIPDGWSIEDEANDLSISAVAGKYLNRIHIESLPGPNTPTITRDFYFTHEGEYDGLGYDVDEEPPVKGSPPILLVPRAAWATTFPDENPDTYDLHPCSTSGLVDMLATDISLDRPITVEEKAKVEVHKWLRENGIIMPINEVAFDDGPFEAEGAT